ncbi:MAG: membrane protein insertion efficiency factor YidD [Alphaproteobacteria bacterium]|nr:membrane protein insertion efficiency factor YidD [Alphaproteobacteria bacterium]
MTARLAARLWRARLALVTGPVRLYQRHLSLAIGARCIYRPSCSQYMIDAVERYGLLRGVAKGLGRIARCRPQASGGYDPA